MKKFSRRSVEAELMDRDDISFEEFHDCLQGLETINHLTFAYKPTLNWIDKWMQKDESLVVLDVGSGGGDMLRQIAKKYNSYTMPNSIPVLIGVDLNPWAKRSSQSHSMLRNIRYETANVFTFQPDQPVDIIISSLFTHHLSDSEIINFLCWMDKRARKGWFINDLHRHPLPYYFIKFATRLFSRNRLIRNDAAVSVARAFTRMDWQQLLLHAGIHDRAKIRWHFPFRLCISCGKA